MNEYFDKIFEILDNASCDKQLPVEDYILLLNRVIEEAQSRMETIEY